MTTPRKTRSKVNASAEPLSPIAVHNAGPVTSLSLKPLAPRNPGLTAEDSIWPTPGVREGTTGVTPLSHKNSTVLPSPTNPLNDASRVFQPSNSYHAILNPGTAVVVPLRAFRDMARALCLSPLSGLGSHGSGTSSNPEYPACVDFYSHDPRPLRTALMVWAINNNLRIGELSPSRIRAAFARAANGVHQYDRRTRSFQVVEATAPLVPGKNCGDPFGSSASDRDRFNQFLICLDFMSYLTSHGQTATLEPAEGPKAHPYATTRRLVLGMAPMPMSIPSCAVALRRWCEHLYLATLHPRPRVPEANNCAFSEASAATTYTHLVNRFIEEVSDPAAALVRQYRQTQQEATRKRREEKRKQRELERQQAIAAKQAAKQRAAALRLTKASRPTAPSPAKVAAEQLRAITHEADQAERLNALCTAARNPH